MVLYYLALSFTILHYPGTFTFSFGHYCLDSRSINMWFPIKASEGRLAQLMMILAATAFLLLTMEIFAAVCMNNFVFSHLFAIPFIRFALLCAGVR